CARDLYYDYDGGFAYW
nr:immunoglobulin heavy chain junction region [Mus musculus]